MDSLPTGLLQNGEFPHGDAADKQWMVMEYSHRDTASVRSTVSLGATSEAACALAASG
jgi:hypothetical protein